MAIFDKSLATALKISCACAAVTAASAAWAQDRGEPPAPTPRTTQEPALAASPDVGGRDDIIVEALKQGAGTVIEAQAFIAGAQHRAQRIALVSSALGRMQFRRLAIDPSISVFASLDAAEAWLCDGACPPGRQKPDKKLENGLFSPRSYHRHRPGVTIR